MKILKKMIFSFLIVVCIFSIMAATSIYLTTAITKDITIVDENKYPINQHATNYQIGANYLWVGTYIYLNGDVPLGRQMIQLGKDKMTESRTALTQYLPSDKIGAFETKEKVAIQGSDVVIASIIEQGINPVPIEQYDRKIQFNIDFCQKAIDSLNSDLEIEVTNSQKDMVDNLNIAKTSAQQNINITVTMLIISLIVSILVAYIISIKFTTTLVKLTELADKVTSGEFDAKFPEIKSKDEIADLAGSLEMLITAFKMQKDRIQNAQKPAVKEKSK
jgi:methyl-accepting chemotaxis protein